MSWVPDGSTWRARKKQYVKDAKAQHADGSITDEELKAVMAIGRISPFTEDNGAKKRTHSNSQ